MGDRASRRAISFLELDLYNPSNFCSVVSMKTYCCNTLSETQKKAPVSRSRAWRGPCMRQLLSEVDTYI